MNLLQRCIQKNLLPRGSYPQFIENGTLYQVIMGSQAYGIATESSDIDIYGFCVPPKDVVFPHTAGKIYNFDSFEGFDVWQNHHVKDPDRNKEYDFSIYNLVRYVRLLTDGNPNIIDSLFVPRNCILHSTPVSEQLRQNKHLFLHKGCFYKFTGYMMSQISKLDREPTGKRKESFDKWGFDLKYASHAVRLGLQLEQVLTEGDLQLDRNRETLKSIRKGEWTVKEVKDWVHSKERDLQTAYTNSKLPNKPDTDRIRQLLIDMLEHHFGSAALVEHIDKYEQAFRQIAEIVHKNG